MPPFFCLKFPEIIKIPAVIIRVFKNFDIRKNVLVSRKTDVSIESRLKNSIDSHGVQSGSVFVIN